MIIFNSKRTLSWLTTVFGSGATTDVEERGLRFGEEALELIQSLGVTREQANALVKQVFDKPVGEPIQELGGVLVTLDSLCAVTDLDADEAYSNEWARVEEPGIIEKIQRKHAGKLVVSAKHRPVA